MNTVKIYFDTDGSIREVRKDFQLYQGQFHDKLLNVYVPTSVLAPNFIVENEQGQTIADFVASTSVKVGMKYVARDGSIKKSKNYYMNYLKVMTQNGVEYAVFERKLPKEFTVYNGQGQNAPKLVVNVVNLDTDSQTPTVLSVITTQECFLEVMPSADLDNDDAVEPSEWEVVNGEINALKATMLEKQDKVDELLQTEVKTVVGAINENKGDISTNATAIGENSADIAELRNDVINLQALLATGETPIGKTEGDELPTDEQLNTFVQSIVAREQAVGDVVIFVLNDTTTYKYTYTEDGWQSYEITTVDKADNSNYGTIKGTYTAEEQSAKTRNILVDINNGEIENLHVKINNTYRNLKQVMQETENWCQDVENGLIDVGSAYQALKDIHGNPIATTYLKKTEGATKQYVQDYAVPKQFTSVYFVSGDGYEQTVPTGDDAVFSGTSASVGETPIIAPMMYKLDTTVNATTSGVYYTKDGDTYTMVTLPQDYVEGTDYYKYVPSLSFDLTASFDLSQANSYRNTFWVVASENCSVQCRLVTQYKKAGQDWADLNIELSEEYPLVGENYERIDMGSQFLSLGSNVVSLEVGDQIRQSLSVKTSVATEITFSVYSNDVYPSTFNLISQNYVPAGATSVLVNGSPVSVFDADTKADKFNRNQVIYASQFTAEKTNGNHLSVSVTDDGEGYIIGTDYVEICSQNGKSVSIISENNISLIPDNGVVIHNSDHDVMLDVHGKIKTTVGFSDGNNLNNHVAQLPNTTSWTENKTIAMTDLLPVGSIIAFAGKTVPSGYLWCNGNTFNQNDYPLLYAVLGNSNTLPNLNRRFIEGTNTANDIGTTVSAGLPNIKGSFSSNRLGIYQDNSASLNGAFDVPVTEYTGSGLTGASFDSERSPLQFSFDASKSNAIYSDSVATVQPNSYKVMYIIKAL